MSSSLPIDEHAFLKEIADQPEKDFPRDVYADWLDEQGDPRGQVLRFETRLRSMRLDDPARTTLQQQLNRYLQVAKERWAEWMLPLSLNEFELEGGLPVIFSIPADRFERDGESLIFSIPTLRHWRMRSVSSVWGMHKPKRLLKRIFSSDLFGQLLGLTLPENYFVIANCLTFIAPNRLTELHLNRTRLRDSEMKVIVTQPQFSGLQRLSAMGTSVGPRSLRRLANSTTLTNLRHLDLTDCSMWDQAGLDVWLQSPNASPLESLSMAQNSLGDTGAIRIATSEQLSNLKSLRLSRNGLTDTAAKALFESETLSSLQILNVRGNEISREWLDRLRERFLM